MELNSKQKAGALVAAIAVVALGVDRFVLGGNGPASASAQVLAPEAEAAAVTQTDVSKSGTTFAQQLEQFAARNHIDPDAGIPDAFGDAEVWTVTAVMGNGDQGAVRIGNEMVRVGSLYRDAILVRVDRDGGVFSRFGREFRAALVRPGLRQDR